MICTSYQILWVVVMWRRMGWSWHVERRGQEIWENWGNETSWRGLDWCDSEWRQVTGSCERGNEHPVSLQFGEFLDLLRNLSSQEGLCFVEIVVTEKFSHILIRIGGPLQTWTYIFIFFFRLLLFMGMHSKWLISWIKLLPCLHRWLVCSTYDAIN